MSIDSIIMYVSVHGLRGMKFAIQSILRSFPSNGKSNSLARYNSQAVSYLH